MLSVVLATHNEEKNIKRCLDSIQKLADEIIVVDGESQDKTVEIAKQCNATVIQTTNKPNFHINKQLAMDAAQGELILQLDADEVVDKELASCIEKLHQELVRELHESSLEEVCSSRKKLGVPVAWWLKRKNLFLGRFLRKGGQYPDPVIRLFVRSTSKLPQKDVHEQMVVNGELGWTGGHLIHYANPSFEDYLRKWNTYTSFKAEQLNDLKLDITISSSINMCLLKPVVTFLSLYIRHKGFVDGVPGLVFAVMSGLHHLVAYLKLWEKRQKKGKGLV